MSRADISRFARRSPLDGRSSPHNVEVDQGDSKGDDGEGNRFAPTDFMGNTPKNELSKLKTETEESG